MKAVVLLSGGLDSSTLLGQLAQETTSELIAVSFIYGQRHISELKSAQWIADYYDAEHVLIELPNIFWGGGDSALQPGEKAIPMPHQTYEEIAEGEGPSPTVVPFRNANFISMATVVAVTREAEYVYAGMHAEDARGWAYPDCTPEFTGAMANAVRVGTYDKVRFATPFQWMMKADIVALGLRLGVPYQYTISCYEGAVPACGKCPTCVERLEAFKANDTTDPIPYQE